MSAYDEERNKKNAELDAELARMKAEIGLDAMKAKLYVNHGCLNGQTNEEFHLLELARRLHSKEDCCCHKMQEQIPWSCFHEFHCKADGCKLAWSYDSGD